MHSSSAIFTDIAQPQCKSMEHALLASLAAFGMKIMCSSCDSSRAIAHVRGVCKSNDLNDTLLTVNAKCRTLFWFLHYTIKSMWHVVRLDSSRVATLVKVRSATRSVEWRPDSSQVEIYTSIKYDFTANQTLPMSVVQCANQMSLSSLCHPPPPQFVGFLDPFFVLSRASPCILRHW